MSNAVGHAAPMDTLDWVRDAVFYHIFPDRFARSPRLGSVIQVMLCPERATKKPCLFDML